MSRATITTKVQGKRQRFTLQEGELTTIGRASSCAVQINDKSVSREHCVAIFTNGRLCLNDLGSKHGVVHDGERVDRCDLAPGDSCQLGAAHLTFEAVLDAGSEPPPEPEPEAPPAPEPEPEPKPRTPEPAVVFADDDLPAEPGQVIGGYRVDEVLGTGGFGVVYRAQQIQLGREVALKVLRLDDRAGDGAARVEAFLREARAAASINDPHLVQIHDVGQDGELHFLSMELVSGGSLTRKVRRDGPLDWRAGLELMRDLAGALAAAHRAGLVHRDVKPANVLLTASGRAKLTDLGLASGTLQAGTVAFMAPEQILRRDVDARTDLYALGCTIYAALTGRAPFIGSKDEIAKGHLKDTPESLQRLGLPVPWHFDQLVVESLMAKDPDDRPQSATQLLERLDDLILPDSYPRVDRAPRPATVARARSTGEPGRAGGRNRNKALLARVLSELVVFSISAFIVIALLLGLKYHFPSLDIYRLIGK
ncbi:MAG: protein kinase [Planctomycetes bacterium]|nr:protein kinase [Planctomycetota bacterium]